MRTRTYRYQAMDGYGNTHVCAVPEYVHCVHVYWDCMMSTEGRNDFAQTVPYSRLVKWIRRQKTDILHSVHLVGRYRSGPESRSWDFAKKIT